MMRITALALTASLLCTGAAAQAQSVSYDYDKTARFASFKTYAWVAGTGLSDSLVHQRVIDAIDAQLAAKGLTKAQTAGEADLLVAYHASFDRNLLVTGFAPGPGGYFFAGSRSVNLRAEDVVVGTLIVDVVDARSKTIVWRGAATKDVNLEANPEKRDKNIARVAEKLFKHYPPRES